MSRKLKPEDELIDREENQEEYENTSPEQEANDNEPLSDDDYQKLLDELYPPELLAKVDADNDSDMALAVKQNQFTQAFERMLVNQSDVIRVIRTQTPDDIDHALSLVNMFNAVNEYLGLLAEQVIIAKTERGLRGGDKY